MSINPARITPEGIYIGEILVPASITSPDISITNHVCLSQDSSPCHTISVELLATTVALDGGNYKLWEPPKPPVHLAEPGGLITNITLAQAWGNGAKTAALILHKYISQEEDAADAIEALAKSNPYKETKA